MFENQPFANQLIERGFDLADRLFDPLFHQPPFHYAFKSVLSLRVLD